MDNAVADDVKEKSKYENPLEFVIRMTLTVDKAEMAVHAVLVLFWTKHCYYVAQYNHVTGGWW